MEPSIVYMVDGDENDAQGKDCLPCVNIQSREQKSMYVAIRWGKINPGAMDEVVRRVQDGILPTLRNVPGFVTWYG